MLIIYITKAKRHFPLKFLKNNLSKYEDSKPLLIPIKVGLLSKSGKNIEPSNIKSIDQDKSFIIELIN